MRFDSEHHEEVHHRLEIYLDELFDDPFLDEDNGHFYVGYGSTVLEIAAEPYGPEETIVSVTAYCVQGVDASEALLVGMLELNHQLPIGAFSMVEDDIFLSASLFGRELDRSNLLGTIAAIATTSDDYDDRIVEKFGGQTALDRIRHTGGREQRRSRAD